MSHLTMAGHAYQRPPGYPHDYAGPGDCCAYGRWAPQHLGYADSPVDVERLGLRDQIADLTARVVKARDLAHTYRDAVVTPAARGGFDAILGALADPHTYSAPAQLRAVA